MNPYALAWTVLDLLALFGLLRVARAGESARRPLILMAALQFAGLGSALTSVVVGGPPGVLIWVTMAAVNVALCVAALAVGSRLLATVGLFATALSVGLILLGSFASVMVMAVAAILCLAAALWPRLPSTAAADATVRGAPTRGQG